MLGTKMLNVTKPVVLYYTFGLLYPTLQPLGSGSWTRSHAGSGSGLDLDPNLDPDQDPDNSINQNHWYITIIIPFLKTYFIHKSKKLKWKKITFISYNSHKLKEKKIVYILGANMLTFTELVVLDYYYNYYTSDFNA